MLTTLLEDPSQTTAELALSVSAGAGLTVAVTAVLAEAQPVVTDQLYIK